MHQWTHTENRMKGIILNIHCYDSDTFSCNKRHYLHALYIALIRRVLLSITHLPNEYVINGLIVQTNTTEMH